MKQSRSVDLQLLFITKTSIYNNVPATNPLPQWRTVCRVTCYTTLLLLEEKTENMTCRETERRRTSERISKTDEVDPDMA